jgi:hypothetical protein
MAHETYEHSYSDQLRTYFWRRSFTHRPALVAEATRAGKAVLIKIPKLPRNLGIFIRADIPAAD